MRCLRLCASMGIDIFDFSPHLSSSYRVCYRRVANNVCAHSGGGATEVPKWCHSGAKVVPSIKRNIKRVEGGMGIYTQCGGAHTHTIYVYNKWVVVSVGKCIYRVLGYINTEVGVGG